MNDHNAIVHELFVKISKEDKKAFTTFWRGYVVIMNPEESEIGKKMGITAKGKYALRLSR